MKGEEQLFDLISKMYGEMQEGFKEIRQEMNGGFKEVRDRLDRVENTVVRIENEHGKKLSALFDGYVQHSDQLDRIEKEVSKHEEFMIKRVK